MPSRKELKKQVFEANIELAEKKLVIYTFGNVSAIDRNAGVIAIKPSGVPYEKLSWREMVLVDLDNNKIDTKLNPSSDTRTHLVLYKGFSAIGGIAHTHSVYASAWAQAKKPVPCFGTTHADYVCGEIPCTCELNDEQINNNYEAETGKQILTTLADKDPNQLQMILTASHGPFTWGNNAMEAVHNSVILENLCKMALLTIYINPEVMPVKETLLHKHFFRKHGKNAYYGQYAK
ncbi:MAG TPA: L-ribulose-5-phosphate 4-epimerase [Spirochaetia bacterium]|nr:L-ribulose-5-phosphate 4-epimerase [Spirochaetia bacterium]